MTKEEKTRDKYYQKRYGITLDQYNQMLAKYDGCCWICLRPPTGRRLAVDHDHGHRYVKIKMSRNPMGWSGTAEYLGRFYADFDRKRNEVIRRFRKCFKTVSVRGLLCVHCNLGLRKYSDDPVRLTNAAEYLRNHQGVSQ